jgi:hypothetical protein
MPERLGMRDLAGTFGGGEFRLMVKLGACTKPARVFEHNKPKVRLVNDEQRVPPLPESLVSVGHADLIEDHTFVS